MPNVHQIITAHNKTAFDTQTKASETPTKESNCRHKESCLSVETTGHSNKKRQPTERNLR